MTEENKRPDETQIPEEELVPENDEIIGRAFKWSLAVIGVIAVIVVAIVLIQQEDDVVEETKEKSVGKIADLESKSEKRPQVEFVDVTRESGIAFVHESGARGEKLLPESMGSGAAFLDYDGDGDPDLLLVNATVWPHVAADGPKSTQGLYRNDGEGHFEDVTREAGLAVSCFGMGAAVGDFDGDGDPDLYLTTVGSNRLFRNDSGQFLDVTEASGTGGAADQWSSSSGFFDYDGDGDLDLFVCNYIRWSREIDMEINFTLNGRDRAYGPPTNYQGAQPYLFRNDGKGVFTETAEEAGLHVVNRATGVAVGKSLAVIFEDYDHDGDLDVFVANDTVRNFLYRNSGDGSFEEVGERAGFAYDTGGNATGAMGIDAAFYRNDESLGIGIGNFANEMTSLYVASEGIDQFADEAIIEGIGSPSRLRLSFGLIFFDYDLDGRLDLLQANGHLEEEISQIQASQEYRQPAQLFWNAGPEARACFVEVPREDGLEALAEPIVGRGVTAADIDGDGDLDLLLTQTGGAPKLLRNDQELGHHWLRCRLVGTQSNRDAIGAEVTLVAGGRIQKRRVMPTKSYLCQVELPVTFGLGKKAEIESLTVRWPDGTLQEIPNVTADQLLVIRQDQ